MTEIIYSKATMRILLLRIHEGMEVLAGEVVINANSKCVLSAITGVITHVFVEEGDIVNVDDPLYEISTYGNGNQNSEDNYYQDYDE